MSYFELNSIEEVERRFCTPVQCIRNMFSSTDRYGTLVISEWPYGDDINESDRYYVCRMNWNQEDCENVISEFNELYRNLQAIADNFGDLGDSYYDNVPVLGEDLAEVWNTYVRNFDPSGFNKEYIQDITARRDIVNMAKKTEARMERSEEISEDEMSLYEACRDEVVFDNELEMLADYKAAIVADSVERIGESFAAYDVIIRAMRVCRLMSLEAPKCITDFEAGLLAQAMVIHKFAKEVTVADKEKCA